MPKQLSALEELVLFELSAVDAGANRKKRFPVFKQHKEMEMSENFEEILGAVLKTELDEEADLSGYIAKAKISEKGVAALKSALRILSAYKDELPKDVLDKLAAAAGYPAPAMKAEDGKKEDEYKYPMPEKKAIRKYLEGMPEEIRKALGVEAPKEDDPMPKLPAEAEAVFKAQADQIEEMKKQHALIEKALKDERDRREISEWVAKAKTELSHVPGKTPEEIGSMLKALADVDPKLAESQFAILKTTSETIAKSALLRSAGQSSAGGGVEPGSAWEEITKKADGFVEKGAGALTREAAIAKVMEIYPDLYSKYLRENPAQVGPFARA